LLFKWRKLSGKLCGIALLPLPYVKAMRELWVHIHLTFFK
jgi:hypothetical protein